MKIFRLISERLRGKKYTVYDVFTPASAAKLTFVERTEQKNDLLKAIKTYGRQIIIYGYTGSGKTTLVTNILQQEKINFVTTSCEETTTINQIILSAFDKLNPYYIEEKSQSTKYKISKELKAKYLGIEAKLNGEINTDNTTTLKRILPVQLSPQRLAEFFGAINCIWVIEDFHKVKNEERVRLAHIMKIFKDIASKDKQTKIIAIGAVGSPRELFDSNKNLKDRVAEIYVPLMREEEIKSIMSKGKNLLRIDFSEKVEEKIINLSNGLASVCHHLCLNLCISQRIDKQKGKTRMQFESNDLDLAVQKYVKEQSDSFKAIYDRATRIEEDNQSNEWTTVINAMLGLQIEEITYTELLNEIRKIKPFFQKDHLTYCLEQLTSPERDEVLRFDDDSKKYSFSNPFFKVYAMMRLERDLKHRLQKVNKTINVGSSSIIIHSWGEVNTRIDIEVKGEEEDNSME
ncbi:MAG: hypothetical protein DHS20C18_38890 [Saprospiraceae bacterium]|nr:MAG: hypothetical protein DHS20C18_38890 [Saprospiraceae bacterium]